MAQGVIDLLYRRWQIRLRAGGDIGRAAGVLAVAPQAAVEVQRAAFPGQVQVGRRRAVFHVDGARAAGAEGRADEAWRAAGRLQQRRLVARGLHQVFIEVPGQAQLLLRQIQAGRGGQLAAVQNKRLGQLGVAQGIAGVVDRGIEHHGGKRAAGVGLALIRAAGKHIAAVAAVIRWEHARETARIVGVAEVFAHAPALPQLERCFQSHGIAFDVQAVVDAGGHALVILVQHHVGHPVRRIETGLARVDAGDFRDAAIAHADRHRQGRGRLVVEVLERQAHEAAVEFMRDIAANLAALFAVDTTVADAFARAPGAADEEARALRNRRAVIEVHARLVVAQATAEGHAATLLLAILADEIDDAARRIGGQGGGRTAAHYFQMVQGGIDLDEAVGRGEVEVAELQHRQAVFLDLHIARAAGGNGQAAHGDVGIAFAARGLGPQARHRAQDFGGAGGRVVQDGVEFHAADGIARFHFGCAAGGARDHDAFQVQAIGGSGAGGVGGRLRLGGAQLQHGQGDGCGHAAALSSTCLHLVSSVVCRYIEVSACYESWPLHAVARWLSRYVIIQRIRIYCNRLQSSTAT